MAAETRPVQPLGSLVLRVEAEQEQRYSEQQVHSSTCRSFKSGAAIHTQATEEQKETCGGRRGNRSGPFVAMAVFALRGFQQNCIKLFFERDILLTLDELA